jgi:hypothetical protein
MGHRQNMFQFVTVHGVLFFNMTNLYIRRITLTVLPGICERGEGASRVVEHSTLHVQKLTREWLLETENRAGRTK